MTLCPQIKTKQTVFNYTKYFNAYQKDWSKANTLDPSQLSLLKSAAQICKTVPQGLLKTFKTSNTTKDIYTNLRRMAPKLSDIMYHCEFNGHKTSKCANWFNEVWTEEGVCYTFNMLNASELYRQHKYLSFYINIFLIPNIKRKHSLFTPTIYLVIIYLLL